MYGLVVSTDIYNNLYCDNQVSVVTFLIIAPYKYSYLLTYLQLHDSQVSITGELTSHSLN